MDVALKAKMQEIQRFVFGLLGALVRVALWGLTAVLALFLLGLALVLLALGVLWALLRGKRPTAPVFVAQFQRYATERVWPGAAGRGPTAAPPAEVVDVEVREVRDTEATVAPAETPPGPQRLDGPERS